MSIDRLTGMQRAAIMATIDDRELPGATPVAVYHRLRRAAIRLGVHRPRAVRMRSRSYVDSDRVERAFETGLLFG